VIVDAAGDQGGVVVGGGLILLEGAFEGGEEFVGVFVLEEEGFGGASVLEVVHAGGESGGGFGIGLV